MASITQVNLMRLQPDKDVSKKLNFDNEFFQKKKFEYKLESGLKSSADDLLKQSHE